MKEWATLTVSSGSY